MIQVCLDVSTNSSMDWSITIAAMVVQLGEEQSMKEVNRNFYICSMALHFVSNSKLILTGPVQTLKLNKAGSHL